MNDNPYRSPDSFEPQPAGSRDIHVDGSCLVVQDGAILPSRCVFTNQPATDQDRRIRKFDGSPSFRLVVSQKSFQLSYCVSRSVRQRMFRRTIFASTISVILMIGLYVATGSISTGIFAPIPIFISSRLSSYRLRTVKSRDGSFWLAGCCPEFLAECRQTFENGWTADVPIARPLISDDPPNTEGI